jgi:phosphate-selective porin OprO/OprP
MRIRVILRAFSAHDRKLDSLRAMSLGLIVVWLAAMHSDALAQAQQAPAQQTPAPSPLGQQPWVPNSPAQVPQPLQPLVQQSLLQRTPGQNLVGQTPPIQNPLVPQSVAQAPPVQASPFQTLPPQQPLVQQTALQQTAFPLTPGQTMPGQMPSVRSPPGLIPVAQQPTVQSPPAQQPPAQTPPAQQSNQLASLAAPAVLPGASPTIQPPQANQLQSNQPNISPLPPVMVAQAPAPQNTPDPQPVDPNVRLQQLERTVGDQQAQIQSLIQQSRVTGAVGSGQSTSDNGPSFYPGTAASAPDVGPISNQPYTIGSDRILTGAWTNDGPVFTTKHKDFTFHPRFVAQLDMIGVKTPSSSITVPGANSAGTLDSVDFRRLRLGCDGVMWENIEYVLEFDYAAAMFTTDPSTSSLQVTSLRSTGTTNQFGGTPGVQGGNVMSVITPTTTFLIYRQIPVISNLRVGQQQDWFSLEHIESARFLDFMERSPIFDAFAGPNNAGYSPGISTFRSYMHEKVQMQLGAYKTNMYDKEFSYDIGNSNYTYGGRVVYTPYYDELNNGRYLVHMAVGAEQREFNNQLNPNLNGDNIRLRTRGDLRNTTSQLTPNYLDTGNFYATGQAVLDPEIAIQWGSLLIQGEYCLGWMENAATQQGGRRLHNAAFGGGYVEALYFLTGESRPYLREAGVFGRTVPLQNGYLLRGAGLGTGAWQVGARYDYMSLNSPGINGGQLQDMTLGLNWWLNPNARIQFNYVLSHIDNTATVGTPVPSGSGVLSGSKYTGDGFINNFGIRQDFNF